MAKKTEPGRLDIRPPYGAQTKPEGAMIKTIPPIEDKGYDDMPVEEQTVVEDGREPEEEAQVPDAIQDLTRKTPVQMKFVITKTEDYDSPFRVDVEETGPTPEENGDLECPNCGECHPFKQASISEKKTLSCPKCGQKIASEAIIKTASGYRAVIAKCLDPVFKSIRGILDSKLSKEDATSINTKLDVIYKKYRNLEKELGQKE